MTIRRDNFLLNEGISLQCLAQCMEAVDVSAQVIQRQVQVIRNDPMTVKDAYEFSKTWIVSIIL